MPDPTLLLDAAERLADRFRAMPQSRLATPVPGHPSRAAAGLALARELSVRAQAYEGVPRPREMPDAGPFAVGDQLAVAAHDLAAVLAAGDDSALRDAVQAVADVDRLCAG